MRSADGLSNRGPAHRSPIRTRQPWSPRACWPSSPWALKAQRLLMRSVASTNVMTTNTTQIAIDATELFLAWLERCRRGGRIRTIAHPLCRTLPIHARISARNRRRHARLCGDGGALAIWASVSLNLSLPYWLGSMMYSFATLHAASIAA